VWKISREGREQDNLPLGLNGLHDLEEV